MTITPFQIYLWGIADNLGVVFAIGAGACCVGLFVAFMAYVAEGEESGLKWVKKLIAGAVTFGLLTALTPTSHTIAAMYVVPVIANSSVVQKDMPEAYALAKQFLVEKLTKKDE